MKILIVEDEFIVAAYMKKFLHRNGHEVVAITDDFNSSMDALNLAPELCLVDIRLSKGDSGIEIAHNLRQKNIPFAFVSANNEKDTLLKAKETNPVAFISKPVNESEILELIHELSENSPS
ncbi:MAG: response regulator [Crocinitomicaceae bacterium]